MTQDTWQLGDLFAYRVAPEHVPFVVPFEARGLRVGADYFSRLASRRNGHFARSPQGIGLMDDFGVLAGPNFDPDRVHPRIRRFYERTSEYRLSIRPAWDRLFQPAFWLFRKALADRIDQCSLPFDLEEAQQGVLSHIDTIDFDRDGSVDLRGWVRHYRDSGEVLYVGIYTTFRHDDVGYVSVGFPFPQGNLTATLAPAHPPGDPDALLLRTHYSGTPFAGDYLASVDDLDGQISVLKLDGFEEEIEVYVRGDRLLTDHRFYLLGRNFLTLYYTIEDQPAAASRGPLLIVVGHNDRRPGTKRHAVWEAICACSGQTRDQVLRSIRPLGGGPRDLRDAARAGMIRQLG